MSLTPARHRAAVGLVAATAIMLTGACATSSKGSGSTSAGGVTTLKLWTHNGGNKIELAQNTKVVNEFNASQTKHKVEIQSFPQAAYNDAVTAAAAAKKLPCIMDIDGPNVPNWAWAGYLQPLDLPESTFASSLPSTLGKIDGKIYSFGHYDVALNIMTRKSILTANGIRVPTLDQPWTKDELDAALAKLKAGGKYQYPLDLGTSGTGEWLPYAYSPILASFGGDLINRDGYKSAEGVLNGPKALEWAAWMRGVIDQKYAAAKSGADSTADFVNGKTALVYTGSWAADAATKKYGSDILFLPTPDFGAGSKIGGASWQWGMAASCPAKDGALAFLKFSAQPKYYAEYANTLGLIPANLDAAKDVPNYAPGGKYRVFLDIAEKSALVRPVTPAYPFISTTFAKAARDIISGGDAKTILDKAAKDIDNNIKTNGDYKF